MPNSTRTTVLVAVALVASHWLSSVSLAGPWTPREWQDNEYLLAWPRDRNDNFVDDAIEEINDPVDIIVAMNQCIGEPSNSALINYLNSLGDVSYVGKYLSFAVVTGVDADATLDIAARDDVALVELDHPIKWLDIERQALKVQNSNTYSNTNLSLKTWPQSLDGSGVNIAILDSGVDESHPEIQGAYRHGYNAITQTEVNPPASGIHGTYMARFALGSGELGIAPSAGFIDMKVGSSSGGEVSATLAALDKVIEKRKDWNIGVVNLSMTFDLNPPYDKNDGNEALSWLVNRVVSEGVTVVAAAGNGPDQKDFEIKPPATASGAITVGAADVGTDVGRSQDTVECSTSGPKVNDGDADPFDELKPEVTVPSFCTSPAAARTSGLAALVLQKAPDINPGALKDLLIQTAETRGTAETNVAYPKDSPTWNKEWGFGYVDAFAVFENLQKPNAADLTFRGYDGSAHPNTPWYMSRAIKILRNGNDVDNVTESVSHTIKARLINKGASPAKNVRVTFGFYQFTAGIPRFYDIGSDVVSTISATGEAEASIDWTPSALQANAEHGCLNVVIEYGLDKKFADMSNVAQRNLKVAYTASSAVFEFEVGNTLSNAAQIELKVTQDKPGWKLQLSDSVLDFSVFDCAKPVRAVVEPPLGAAPGDEAMFYVTAFATELGTDDPIAIGGVALKARVPREAAR